MRMSRALRKLDSERGRMKKGVILLLTLGTGIGSALFIDGTLVPNTEFGHVELKGRDAEYWAAESVRKKRKLSWRKWARQVNLYLQAMEFYLSPDLIIIGGGASSKHEKFIPQLEARHSRHPRSASQ